MKKKDYKFIDEKLKELSQINIISEEQYQMANNYFNKDIKEKMSIATIFTAIGVLLMALSMITIFAFNWDTIFKEVKIAVAFIPILITIVMLYFTLKKEDSKMKLYTSIVAPIAILATNSLLTQIFHIQTEIYELILTSLIMFLPIAFYLRSLISLIVYGIGGLIYTFSALESYNTDIGLLYSLLVMLPLIIYNIINYIRNKDDKTNYGMWIVNVIFLSIILFHEEILRPEVLVLYLYTIYVLTSWLFNTKNVLSRLIYIGFFVYLMISCISTDLLSYVENITIDFDTLLLTLISFVAIYFTKMYKDSKEYFILAFVLLIEYTGFTSMPIFILANIIALLFGVYKLVIGNQNNIYAQKIQGVIIILLLALFRFINSDFDFLTKSIIFLLTGVAFIIIARNMKPKIEEIKNDEVI